MVSPPLGISFMYMVNPYKGWWPSAFPKKPRYIFRILSLSPPVFKGHETNFGFWGHLAAISRILKVASFWCAVHESYFPREPQQTPVSHTPGIRKPPNERNSFINCWFRVWGMFQGYVGKILDTWMWCGGFFWYIYIYNVLSIQKRSHSKSTIHGSVNVWILWECLMIIIKSSSSIETYRHCHSNR